MQRDLEDLSAEKRVRSLSFRLPQPERAEKSGGPRVADMQFAFSGHDPLWPTMDFQIFRGQKIALVAPNGTGKTTLIKLLSGEIKAQQRHRASGIENNARLLLPAPDGNPQHNEYRHRRDAAPVRPARCRRGLKSILGLFLLGEGYFERKVESLSGGEKSRLVMASLFMARTNFLLLDEPTNHLDLESREALVTALKAL